MTRRPIFGPYSVKYFGFRLVAFKTDVRGRGRHRHCLFVFLFVCFVLVLFVFLFVCFVFSFVGER